MAVRSVQQRLWRWAPGAFVFGFALSLALFDGSGSTVREVPESRELVLVDNLTSNTGGVATWNADGVTTCTSAGTDDGAYSLSGYKLPANGSPYKVNAGTVPTYLSASAVQTAVVAAFSAWDAATSKALFANGGTTTAIPGRKDGVNSVGFGNLGSGIVGQATAWVDSRTHVILEFDFVLSTAYTWSTNSGKTGDCGGDPGAFDVQAVATHEAGHTTGMNDRTATADHAQTMFGSAAKGELYKRDLANGDRQGVIAAYGP
jgi:hypothetical protein